MVVMVILVHVIIALASIVATTAVFIRPSEAKLEVSYGLIAGTFISGTYLVLSKQAALLPTCETGLFYLAAMLAAVFVARRRLAAQRLRVDRKR